MPDAGASAVGAAVEAALLPLRLQATSLKMRGLARPLEQVDAALAPVHEQQGHSRCAIRLYLKAHVFIDLKTGIFYENRKELVKRLRRKNGCVSRETAKEFKYAKLFLVMFCSGPDSG